MNRMISFGYGYKDGKLIVVESEAEIVKSIFTDYINGKILKEIADELTIKGIDFFNGKCCWNKNMVFRIIENKKYIGIPGQICEIHDTYFDILGSDGIIRIKEYENVDDVKLFVGHKLK